MRVAICMSGQLRTWKKCYKSVQELIKCLNHDVDIFCHAWNFDSVPRLTVSRTGKETIRVHSQQVIEEVLSVYKPISYCIEDQERNKKAIDDVIERAAKLKNKAPITWSSPQFYSLAAAAKLKSAYELENNFKYDVCIRLRYDQYLPEDQIGDIVDIVNQVEANTVYTVHNRDTNKYPKVVYGDIFWISDSTVYDQIALFYKNIPLIESEFFTGSPPPEYVLTHYIDFLGIQNHRTYLDLKVCRFNEFVDEELQFGGEGIGPHEILYEDVRTPSLWTFGCSFTRGDGSLEQDLYGNRFKVEENDLPWTSLLAKQLGLNLKNIGEGGIANDTILDKILLNWDNIVEGDYVIIGKTWSHRFDFPKCNDSLEMKSIVYRGEEKDVKRWFDDATQGIFTPTQIECIKVFSAEFATQPAYSKRHDLRFEFIKKALLEHKKVKLCHIWDVEALWNSFELIVHATEGSINDYHWSFKGHKDFLAYLNTVL